MSTSLNGVDRARLRLRTVRAERRAAARLLQFPPHRDVRDAALHGVYPRSCPSFTLALLLVYVVAPLAIYLAMRWVG